MGKDMKEYKAKYYLEHKVKVKETNRLYREEHKEELRENKKKWYNENKAHVIAMVTLNKQNNAEKSKQYSDEYRKKNKGNLWRDRLENKERAAIKQHIYYESHKETIKKYSQEYKLNNKARYNILQQKRRCLINETLSTLTKQQWETIKEDFNNCCCYCGKELKLTQEHFVPLSKGGEYTHNNIVPSCISCNSSKYDKDFFTWYPKFRHYSKKRETKIVSYLHYNKQNEQQLAFTL